MPIGERAQLAKEQTDLFDRIEPLWCYQFGVVPIGEDSEFIYLAAVGDVDSRVPDLLRPMVPKKLHFSYFPYDLVTNLIFDFVRDETIFFPTFEDESFLGSEDAHELLSKIKVEGPLPSINKLDEDLCLIGDFTYVQRSRYPHANRQRKLVPTGQDNPVFSRVGHTILTLSDEPISPGTIAVIKKSWRFEGVMQAHGLDGVFLDKLPFVIHPYEIQMTGIDADGSIELNFDGKVHKVGPKSSGSIEFSFCRFELGVLLRRDFFFKCHYLEAVSRRRLKHDPAYFGSKLPLPAVRSDLTRWYGLDDVFGR
ncbi:MAG: hypothetical protein NUW37_14190 [Planctomycetes bacterium]|nr:hypothetical protein [Planctomycetota bacterium]